MKPSVSYKKTKRKNRSKILISFLLTYHLLLISPSQAQLVLSGVDSPNKKVAAPSSIRAVPGFRITAGQGTYYHAFIDANGDGIPDINQGGVLPTFGENYIKTTEYLTENGEGGDKRTTLVYFDGLGREKQTIQTGVTPLGKDVVIHHEYDGFGRAVKDFLPVPTNSSNGSLITDSQSLYSLYYGTNYNSQIYYSEKELENSPLNRIFKQAAPGDSWKLGSTNEVKFDYQTNTAAEVRLFKVNLATGYLPSLAENGTYGAGELYKTIVKDENWKSSDGKNNTTEEFKDKEGKVVLKRTYNNAEKHDTQYVYDIYGNLTYVLPPLLSDLPLSAANLNELGYQYQYDERNRLIEKQLPGKGREYWVYDKQDRLVLGQDSEQRKKNQWLFTKYDKFSRVVYTGYITNTSTRSSLQTNAYNRGVNNEIRSAAGFTLGGLKVYYSNSTAIPNGIAEVLSVNYYDDYLNIGAPAVSSVEGQAVLSTTDTRLKGALTGSYSKILDGNTTGIANKIYTYYDAKVRPVRTRIQNYLGGFTQTDSKLNYFRGRIQYSLTTHSRASQNTEITTKEAFTYDKQERLLNHTHQINGGTVEYLTQNGYDELGQLKNKKVGGQNTNALQQVDYRYNIRGWMTDINDINNLTLSGQAKDLFSFRISYDKLFDNIYNQINPLYNGNIAETYWRTSTDHTLREYSYAYDHLNRLTDAFYNTPESTNPFAGNYNERFIKYDKNGNILSLMRFGGLDMNNYPFVIDNLGYTYKPNSNQLLSVQDKTYRFEGFHDGNRSEDDYTYDSNGNMNKDMNKIITQITYNLLNLPIKITSNKGTIEYLYTADGSKVRKTVNKRGMYFPDNSVEITDYLGGFQYEVFTKAPEQIPYDPVGTPVFDDDPIPVLETTIRLAFFPHAEGYVRQDKGKGKYDYVYNYTDHLGNIRLSYTQNKSSGALDILEESHYYPFGLKHTGYANINNQKEYKYKYNGKELQNELDLNVTAMDFRQYDMAIGRFTGMDRLAEMAPDMTPYRFAFNNPILFSDPTGLYEIVDGGYKLTDKNEIASFVSFMQNNQEASVSDMQNEIKSSENYAYDLEGVTVTAGNRSSFGNEIHRQQGRAADKMNAGSSNWFYGDGAAAERLYAARNNELGRNITMWENILFKDAPMAILTLGEGYMLARGLYYGISRGLAVKGGSEIAIQFGRAENQISHAFRHTDALGLNRSVVQSTIENHFKTVSSQVVSGKPFNQIIEIGGQKIQYTGFKLSDGTFNIGRIHGIK